MKKTIITLLCLLVTAICFVACGNNQKEEIETTLPVQTEQKDLLIETPKPEPSVETEQGSDLLDSADAPVGVFEVETPYCMITYPLTWQYNLAIEQANIENGHMVSFYAVIEGRENLQIFDVIFGGDNDDCGDMVGQLETESGMIPVFFKTYSVYEHQDLSYDDSEMLMAMIEDINVIYNGLSVLANFH